MKYEKPTKNKKFKLKLYQKIVLGILALFLVISSIILVVYFKDTIFSNSIMALAIMIITIVVIGGFGLIAFKVINKHDDDSRE